MAVVSKCSAVTPNVSLWLYVEFPGCGDSPACVAYSIFARLPYQGKKDHHKVQISNISTN